MAGLLFTLTTPAIATGTSARTLLQAIAAANTRIKVKEWSVSFTGTSNTATPIKVDLVRQTDAGTGGDGLTAIKMNEADNETLQSTGLSLIDSSEPTTGSTVMSEEIHPQTGYTWQAPFGGEIVIMGGNRLGLRVTAGADVNAVARFVCEE